LYCCWNNSKLEKNHSKSVWKKRWTVLGNNSFPLFKIYKTIKSITPEEIKLNKNSSISRDDDSQSFTISDTSAGSLALKASDNQELEEWINLVKNITKSDQ